MAVAIRAITRVQDADDAPALGAGQQGYALTWNNATGAFVATALVTDHGALSGLTPDDDHTQYALLAGRAGGQTLYGGTAANEDITIHGTSNATRTTSYVLLQPTAGNVGIRTATPIYALHVDGGGQTTAALTDAGNKGGSLFLRDSGGNAGNGGAVLFGSATTTQTTPQAAIKSLLTNGGTNGTGDLAISTRNAASDTALTERMRILAGGNVGIGTTAPATLFHSRLESAATNAVSNVATIGHDTSGTAAAGFGAGLAFQLESSTTAAQSAARVQALWYEATHATRKADLVLTAYDAGGEREGLRIRGAGSAPAIGFYGVTPIVRAVLATGAGATVDNVITALQNLGLVKQS